MSRSARLALAVFCLLIAVVAAWLWPGSASSPGPPARPPATEVDPLLEGWDRPGVTLVLSGEQHGYLEPCGCSESQSGGYSRRADLFRQIRQRGWDVTGLDLGGLVRRNREQSRIKYQTMLAALGEMTYASVAVGTQDLALGPEFLLSQNNEPTAESPTPPLLAANLVLFGETDLPGAPVASRLVAVGTHKIGITAILDPELTEPLRASGVLDDVTLRPPEDVLPAVLDDLAARGATLLILLSHASLERSTQLARQSPRLDLVVSAGGPEDPLTENPRQVGNVTLVTVGHKGKYAGVVGFYPDRKTDRLRFELVNLDQRRFADTATMNEHMKTYQQTLQQLELAANIPPISIPTRNRTPTADRHFVGAARCGECHAKAMQKWKNTPHATAFESLARGRQGQEQTWIPRSFDPECLSCHVTGWHPQDVLPYKTGFVDQASSGHLLGNQCENCHGAGSRHISLIEEGEIKEALAEVRLTLEEARRTTCVRCHDLDNSPTFHFDSYWPKIAHPGRD